MKKTMIKSAIAAASATLLSSGALAFDSLSDISPNQNATGTQLWEPHHVLRVTAPNFPCTPGLCIPGAAVYATSIITNKYVAGSGASGVDVYTGDECTDPDVRIANGTDGSGNTTYIQAGNPLGMLNTVSQTLSFGAGSPGVLNLDLTDNPTVSGVNCELETTASGKYGRVRFSSAFDGGPTIGNAYSYSQLGGDIGYEQQIEIYFGNAADTIAPDLSFYSDLADGTVDASDPVAVATWAAGENLTVLAATRISYLTCDSGDVTSGLCNTIAKSVPVPALAAATLGLGLAGITYLTGRRRSIK